MSETATMRHHQANNETVKVPATCESSANANDQLVGPELTILMPCLNEAQTLATCIAKARGAIERDHLSAEILIADNGSTDGSQEIAEREGARVIHDRRRGYGSALLAGIAAAKGKYVIMADADDSYDLTYLPPFLNKLREGYDLVMGNRFKGEIEAGAMPFLHRYLGTPVLTMVSRIFFGTPCRDVNCGMRGFRKEAIERLGLRSAGMEFASEMLVKSSLFGLRIAEISTSLSRDGRSTPPHLRTWRDGWRHLRFLLMCSPRWLFLYPGLLLAAAGLVSGVFLLSGPKTVGSVTLDIHTLFYSAIAVLMGFQAILFAIFSKTFAMTEGLLPPDKKMDWVFRLSSLEVWLVVGGLLVLAGLGGAVYSVTFWGRHGFGALEPTQVMRMTIPSGLSLALGCQIVFSGFFLSILRMGRQSGRS